MSLCCAKYLMNITFLHGFSVSLLGGNLQRQSLIFICCFFFLFIVVISIWLTLLTMMPLYFFVLTCFEMNAEACSYTVRLMRHRWSTYPDKFHQPGTSCSLSASARKPWGLENPFAPFVAQDAVYQKGCLLVMVSCITLYLLSLLKSEGDFLLISEGFCSGLYQQRILSSAFCPTSRLPKFTK